MRLCHFSDSHLGAGESHTRRAPSGLTERQEDIISAFVQTVDRIIEERPDVVIYSGDLFHAVRPTNKIIALAGEQLHRLAELAQIPTVIISGNHDAPKQPYVGAALHIFKHINNLHIAAGTGLEIFDILDTSFFALPHCLTATIQKEELKKCIPNPSRKHNILIMHGVAAGMPEFSMADLGEQELPLELMNRFDYTALGHYHNFCQVGERAYYSGSTERLSQAEREHDKGYISLTLDPYSVTFKPINCRPMVDLVPINAAGKRGDQLAEMIKKEVDAVGSADKIVRLKITGVSEETLKTLPTDVISDLKENAFALNISFEKDTSEQKDAPQFGRQGIGRLDNGFIAFLETVDLSGFDKKKLIEEALKYLS